jgi:hypothetical protein
MDKGVRLSNILFEKNYSNLVFGSIISIPRRRKIYDSQIIFQ